MLHAACRRAREGVGNNVEQRCHAPYLGGRTAEHRHDAAVDDALVDRFDRLFAGDLLTGKVFLHQRLAGLGNGLEQHIAILVRRADEVLRDACAMRQVALVIIFIDLHVDEVEEAADMVALDHRDEDRADRDAVAVAQRCKRLCKAGFSVVKAVDEEGLRNFRLGGIVPAEVGADLRAGAAVHDNNRRIRHAHRLLCLALKAEVAGRVDHVDLDIVMHKVDHRGRKCKAALDLLGVIVADRIAVRRLAEAIGQMLAVEHCLSKRGLTGRSVSQKDDISDVLRNYIRHGGLLLFCKYSSSYYTEKA